LNNCGSIFDVDGKTQRLAELGKALEDENLWHDPEKAKTLLKERAFLSGRVESWQDLYARVEDCDVLIELAEEESDDKTMAEAGRQVEQLEKKLRDFSLQAMLNGEDDGRNAIVSINAGAGGPTPRTGCRCCFECTAAGVKTRGMPLN